ncbi:death domain-containing protein CRADD [Brienomyrus brachyistius]|uniref:death domain-containing protein CRADD n=1 Tax=Brienomyrus brachyistius TaxID=42636 RepID=UPI0020B2837D|nr:death domain-containing protein CRADD [Brienomyrus brachyistius]
MDPRHKEVIKKHRLYLSEQILIDDTIVQYLYQEDILTESQVEEIQSQVTNKKKTLKLLDILPTRGPLAFDAFLKSLDGEFWWVKEKLEQKAKDPKDGAVTEKTVAEQCAISEPTLQKVPTDQDLNRLAGRLGLEWESVVLDLGLPLWEVQRCRAGHPLSLYGQAMAGLVRWRQRSGRKATVQRLLQALQAADIHPSTLEDVFQ